MQQREETSSGKERDPCADRLLIVDDEKTIRELFRMIVYSAIPELQIDVAVNGAEAVEIFKSTHPKVLLMDLHMPVMDGRMAFFEISRECEKRNWETPSVIFCTGFSPSDSIKQIVEDNPNHCLLAKPVGAETVISAVKERL